MPMNKMNRGVAPPPSAGPTLCQTPGCQKIVIKGTRFCSMCHAKIDSGMSPGRRKKKPAEAPPK